MLASIITEARSTRGDEIKNENVTPIGSPALVNPIKSGMDEQEQKGVTVPSNAPSIFADIPLYLPNIFLVLSGGKKLCIYEIVKIRTDNKINILITSYIKKCRLPPSLSRVLRPNTFSTSSFTKSESHCILSN
jgi:hypothetical protein